MTGRLEFCVAGGRAAAKHVSRESVREMAERFMLSRDTEILMSADSFL